MGGEKIKTIKDISKICGVSPSTVSKALIGYGDIGAETTELVRKVAQEIGYLPNASARTLKTKHSNSIGVIFVNKMQGGLSHEYFSSVLNSVKEEAERQGFDITFISNNIGSNKMSYYEHCQYRHCDGVVIVCEDFYDPDVIELVKSNIPTVTIDHIFDNQTAILSDNIQNMRDLVTHVYDRGHRKIAFIHGEETTVTKLRLASFYKTCEDLKIDIPAEYVIPALYHDPKSSALATRTLLALPNRPTCIMYPDDFSFIGGMNEIEKTGLTIPEDISVVGFDGIFLSQVLRPRLTTLKQDAESIGCKAASKLIESILSPKTFFPQQVIIPGQVLTGDSVKKI